MVGLVPGFYFFYCLREECLFQPVMQNKLIFCEEEKNVSGTIKIINAKHKPFNTNLEIVFIPAAQLSPSMFLNHPDSRYRVCLDLETISLGLEIFLITWNLLILPWKRLKLLRLVSGKSILTIIQAKSASIKYIWCFWGT